MQHRGESAPGSASDLALCLQSLADEGRAVVSLQPPADDDGDAIALLEQMDSAARNELGIELPPFSAEAALWGARLVYQLCRFVVCRDVGEEAIDAACAVACPAPRNPGTDWSADLCLRHLPKLHQLARHLSNADPLVKQLLQIAGAWPLSSVGVPGLENLRLDTFAGHPGLRRLYADRIVAAGDFCRLGDREVDDVLRADLGFHRELAPLMAERLFATS
jgi:hypothetical protein